MQGPMDNSETGEQASGISSNGSSYETLKAEFDAYRAKTKDWQIKIRDRDAKMRAQLQAAANETLERDKQIDNLTAKCGALERDLVAAAEVRRNMTESEAQQTAHFALMTKTIRDEMDAVVAERQQEIQRLRQNLLKVEESLLDERWRASGLHVLYTDRETRTRRNDVQVVLTVDVPDCDQFSYCVSSGRDTDRAWIVSHELEKAKISPKPTESELKRVAEAESRLKWAEERKALEKQLVEEKEMRRRAADEAASGMDNRLAALRRERDESARLQLAALRSQLEVEFELKLKRAAESTGVELQRALAAEKEKTTKERAQYEERIASLEAYKTKAQLAMKALRAPTTPQALQTLPTQDLATHAEVYAKLHSAWMGLAEGHAAAAVALVSDKVGLFVRSAPKYAVASPPRRVDESVQCEMTCLTPPSTKTNVAPETPLLPRVSRQEVAVQCAVLAADERRIPTPPTQPNPAPTSAAVTPPRHLAMTVDFDALLTTASESTVADNRIVSQLQTSLREAREVSVRLERELKEAAVNERHAMEQLTVLKELMAQRDRDSARQRSLEEHAQFVKNIVIKVLNCKDPTVRRTLAPVLSEVLLLSPAERQELAQALA